MADRKIVTRGHLWRKASVLALVVFLVVVWSITGARPGELPVDEDDSPHGVLSLEEDPGINSRIVVPRPMAESSDELGGFVGADDDHAPLVRGSVQDEQGRPVVGAEVLVVGLDSPFEDDASAGYNNYRGKSFATDTEGRFEARCDRLGAGDNVLVVLRQSPRYWLQDRNRWVTVPNEHVDFIVQIRATISITARLVDDSRPFRLKVARVSGGTSIVPSVQGWASLELDESFGGVPLRVSALVNQKEIGPRELVLLAGDRRTLEFEVGGPQVCGRVVSAATGEPLPEAKVFMGGLENAYGDEVLAPQRLESVASVVADPQGKFCINGAERTVTAWHADYSPETVVIDGRQVIEIALQTRGSIRGMIDAQSSIILDKQQSVTVNDGGAFLFDRVAAGAHRVSWGGRQYRVWVRPGETLDMGNLSGGGKIVVALQGEALRAEEYFLACLELDSGVVQVLSGDLFVGEALLGVGEPGRYRLLGGGGVGWEELMTGRNEIDVPAEHVLTVNARPSTRIAIIPSAWGAEYARMAGRVALAVPDGGTVHLWSLESGEHRLWNEDGEARAVFRDGHWTPREIQLGE